MKGIKGQIEALLHCRPNGLTLEEISNHAGVSSKGLLKKLLNELREDYSKRASGLNIINQDSIWKMSVKDEHIETVQEVARPEISTAVLETLAYIAHKKSIRQADVVRIRSNKAYGHIKELIENGFLESKKDGASKKLCPTRKFYEYFKLTEDQPLE